ncbi:MAG: UxaA family hydrolase [Planctomycetes bacterium]|nr:UxaA family hydrolase [Planctomycetota bacterium]
MKRPSDIDNGTARLPHCLQLHGDDNVAVALDDIAVGPIRVICAGRTESFTAIEQVARGHKLSLRPIGDGEVVRKYGVAIGYAAEPIAVGAWVHTHNCRSGLDERSHTLDRHTGAPTDTRYV